MSITILNKTKPKPNIAMDMVGAALRHYKSFERPVKDIVLSPRMWDIFKSGLIQLNPEKEEDINHNNEVEFKDCTIKCGSKFMIKSMTVTLKELVAK